MADDLDKLSDEDFMAALDDAAYGEPEQNENLEDTDQLDDSEPDADIDTETTDTNDDEDLDTDDNTEDGDEEIVEENTQAENDNQEEVSGTDENATTGSSEENANEASEKDGESKESKDTLDYKAEYAKILEEKTRYENFYNEITGEFVANGKKTKGFDDPKKIIQAQQMAAGLGEKMAAFKPYRPFMNSLKERGMLDNPEKFNLAMQLLDGDPEALKKQMKDLNIDPIEIDMDNINYVPKNQVATNIEIALDDVMETATNSGVDEQVRKIISNDWDDDSVIELLEDPQNSADLINHLSNGVYDIVQERIAEKRATDVNHTFMNKTAIEQYREASFELEDEYKQYMQNQQAVQEQPEPVVNTPQEQTEWIGKTETPEEKAYKAKVEQQNALADEARKKAASLSKRKRGTKNTRKTVDPLSLDDAAFTEYMDSIILQ